MRREMGDGRWEMCEGRWEMCGGRREMGEVDYELVKGEIAVWVRPEFPIKGKHFILGKLLGW